MISVLSYNVSWEAMKGTGSQAAACMKEIETSGDYEYINECLNHVTKVLTSTPADFILLQEASGLETLTIPGMKRINHKSGFEDQVTFYKETFDLKEWVGGEFERGRPYTISLFENLSDKTEVVIINVHLQEPLTRAYMSAYKTSNISEETYEQMNGRLKYAELQLLEGKTTELINNALGKSNSKIIIAGDFNYDFGETVFPIKLFGKNFNKEPATLKTCCDFSLSGAKHMFAYDHVLFTDNITLTGLNSPVDNKPEFSDHSPIYCTMTYNKTVGGKITKKSVKKSRKNRKTNKSMRR